MLPLYQDLFWLHDDTIKPATIGRLFCVVYAIMGNLRIDLITLLFDNSVYEILV